MAAPTSFPARTVTVVKRIWAPHPVSVYMASALGNIYGRAIAGFNGAVVYGYPGLDTNKTNYQGYAAPQQMFMGWSPRRAAGGSILPTPSQLPATSPPATSDNPLLSAVAMISAGDQDGY